MSSDQLVGRSVGGLIALLSAEREEGTHRRLTDWLAEAVYTDLASRPSLEVERPWDGEVGLAGMVRWGGVG